MAIIQPLKKLFNWETAHERIQDAPLYKIDWLTITDPRPTVEVNSWRGIIDMENFPGNLDPLAQSINFRISGPQVASTREQFYIQLTPYYKKDYLSLTDNTIPYLLPVGIVSQPTAVAEIAIHNLGAPGVDNWSGPFYVYFELGVNYAGK